jgi:nucleoside-diphosphate-sugar epimerase
MSEIETNPNPPSDEFELMERLTHPSPAVMETARDLNGDVVILGAGGKMGASLALLLHRSISAAGMPHKVVCVSRFTDASVAMMLGRAGIRTIGCDLFDRKELERLPDAPNVLYLVGSKFGASANPTHTWAVNAYLPALVAERYRTSRIVALSTGNVYPFVAPETGGATEDTAPDPVGEYAQSCLGRERIFAYMSERQGTPVLLVRLNYATDLRYGVLVDIAQKVNAGEPVNVAMGFLNTIWQGDANAVLLQAFRLCATPPPALNLTGPEILSVRSVATELAALMGVAVPTFEGSESPTALLSNASRCWSLFPGPAISTETLIRWTAHWTKLGGTTIGKPTHFEVRDGKF